MEENSLHNTNILKRLSISGATYERVVLSLFSKSIGKEIVKNLDNSPPDAVVNSEVFGLPSPVAVEVKRAAHPQLISKLVNRLSGREFESLVVIVDNASSAVKNFAKKTGEINGLNVLVLNTGEIMSSIETTSKQIEDIILSEEAKAYSEFFESLATDKWKVVRDKRLEQVADALRSSQLSLALGAGVSNSLGLPNWNELVSKLLIKLYASKISDIDNDMQLSELDIQMPDMFENASPLISSRYIQKGLADNFKEAVSEVLYDGFNKDRIDSDPLLASIAKLCAPPRNGVGLQSVLTYNFDDLLEQKLEHSSIGHQSIYRSMDSQVPNLLPIYHVHGFMPSSKESYDGVDDSLLVFSEEGYHQLFNEPFSWSNLIQLAAFRDSSTLMIGLSLADPSLRRLLDVSYCQSGIARHFVFRKRYKLPKVLKKPKKQSAKISNEILNIHHRLEEETMSDLGVVLLWLDSYDEIPGLLDQISKSAFGI